MAQKTLKTLHCERSNFIWIYVSALIWAIFGAKIQTFTKRYKQDKYNFWHKIQIRYFGGFSNAWPPEKGFACIFLFHWFLSVVGNVSKSNPLHKAILSIRHADAACDVMFGAPSMYEYVLYDAWPPTVYWLRAYTMPYLMAHGASAETQVLTNFKKLFLKRWTAKFAKVQKLQFIIFMEQLRFVIVVEAFSWGQYTVGFTKCFVKDMLPSVKSIPTIVKAAKNVDLKSA